MKMYKTLHAEQRSALKLLSTRTFQLQEPSVTTTIRRSVLGQHNPLPMMLLPPGECNGLSTVIVPMHMKWIRIQEPWIPSDPEMENPSGWFWGHSAPSCKISSKFAGSRQIS